MKIQTQDASWQVIFENDTVVLHVSKPSIQFQYLYITSITKKYILWFHKKYFCKLHEEFF